MGESELGVLEPKPTKRAQQHIGHGGEPKPELVGPHRRRRGPVRKQVALTLLDAVLHVASGAIDLLIKVSGPDLPWLERGHDEARVRFDHGLRRAGGAGPAAERA